MVPGMSLATQLLNARIQVIHDSTHRSPLTAHSSRHRGRADAAGGMEWLAMCGCRLSRVRVLLRDRTYRRRGVWGDGVTISAGLWSAYLESDAMRTATPVSPLPADVTSFVGRRSEVKEVRRLLSVARLVTLTGIGGVGKTRLALRVAREMERAFEDGVFLVELAPLQDPALLPHTVSDALAVPERSAREPVTVLADYLQGRQILLVLDNCEHVLEAAADLADRVLRAAPEVRVLATSRQVLRIAGEHVYPVPPLPTPDPNQPMESGTATQYPSVSLFADRAAAVVPGFVLTPENEPAVIRLCQRLEGIPLAIELASVRLRVLALDDLANQ